MARRDDAIVGSEERGMGRGSSTRKYCFQAWHFGDDLATETYYNNQAMARYLEEHLEPNFAQKLHIRAAAPANRVQARAVPRTVYVSVRKGVSSDDEEDIITAFRDEQYGNLVTAYFQHIQKTLDFYNCFVEGFERKIICDHFSTVRVRKAFYQRRNELRLPREESWGDISKGLTRGTLSIPVNAAVTVSSYIRSWFRSDNPGPEPQPGNPRPAQANTATSQHAQATPEDSNAIQAVTDALRNLFEWFTAQSESTQAAATAGTARSYCQFKEKTRELVTLLKPLNQAYKKAENEGKVLDLSTIWKHLVHADTARHHGEDLIINLNQTGLLDAVVARHSATKSTVYAIGSASGVGMAVYGFCALTGWPMFAAIAVGLVTALGTGSKSWEHKKYRDRIREMKVDFDSFRKAWDDVMVTLALQFATSAGVAVTIEDEARDYILRSFGLDSRDFNESAYTMASLSMRVEFLEEAFLKFTNNVKLIDEKENLGLRRA